MRLITRETNVCSSIPVHFVCSVMRKITIYIYIIVITSVIFFPDDLCSLRCPVLREIILKYCRFRVYSGQFATRSLSVLFIQVVINQRNISIL